MNVFPVTWLNNKEINSVETRVRDCRVNDEIISHSSRPSRDSTRHKHATLLAITLPAIHLTSDIPQPAIFPNNKPECWKPVNQSSGLRYLFSTEITRNELFCRDKEGVKFSLLHRRFYRHLVGASGLMFILYKVWTLKDFSQVGTTE